MRDRALLRRHLRELEERRESLLRDIGGLALEMYRRESFNGDLLGERAAEVSAVDRELKLVQLGIERGWSVDELERRAGAGGGAGGR